jgi:hypothetical protein
MEHITNFISKFHDIETVADVKEMIKLIYTNLNLNFHPDTPFEDYINQRTGLPVFTLHQAELMNNIVEKAFDICQSASVDLYEIGLEIHRQINLPNIIEN